MGSCGFYGQPVRGRFSYQFFSLSEGVGCCWVLEGGRPLSWEVGFC